MSKRTKELLRANNALDAQLNKANQQVMTNIVVYIRSANISEYEQELVRRDIMHMLLNAQAEGRTAKDVLGEDAQAFCEAVIAALPPRSQKERLLDSVRNVLLAFVVLGVIWLAYGVIDMVGAQDWPYLPLTLGDVIGQGQRRFIFFTASPAMSSTTNWAGFSSWCLWCWQRPYWPASI